MVKMILGGLNGSELLKILKMVLSCTKTHKMTPNGPEWFWLATNGSNGSNISKLVAFYAQIMKVKNDMQLQCWFHHCSSDLY